MSQSTDCRFYKVAMDLCRYEYSLGRPVGAVSRRSRHQKKDLLPGEDLKSKVSDWELAGRRRFAFQGPMRSRWLTSSLAKAG